MLRARGGLGNGPPLAPQVLNDLETVARPDLL